LLKTCCRPSAEFSQKACICPKSNNMKKKLIWILILLVFTDCSPKNTLYESYDHFPELTNLTHQLIKLPPVVSQPMHIVLLETALVITDLKSDHFFHIFNYPGFTYSGSFVRKGKGPGEELFINPFVHKTQDDLIVYQSVNFINTLKFNPASASLEIAKSLEVIGNLIDFQQMFPLGESYIAWNLLDDCSRELLLYDPSQERTFSFGPPLPDYGRQLPLAKQKMISDKIFSVKPDQKKFAALFFYFPILRIYAADGTLLKDARYNNHQQFPEAVISEYRTAALHEKVMINYQKIKSTDQFIYGLYVGKTHGELPEMSDFYHFHDNSAEIHVWDWEGNPVRKLLLDKKIFSFDVSRDDKVLIGSSVNDPDHLFRFAL
jgi:hypothetical protein